MNKFEKEQLSEFAQDMYDVLAMNTNNMTQDKFFDKYVANDNAFMICDEGDVQTIFFDDYEITIKRVRK